MAERVTTMRLKVDLQCEKCYKKVKKVLCKFPQIRDQVFDEKQNIVTIKVVCCSPAKLRDKLCCKGCGAIKSIEIMEPPKPKLPEPEKPKQEKPKPAQEKPKEPEKTKVQPEKRKELEKPKCQPLPLPIEPEKQPAPTCCVPCSEGRPGGPCFEGYVGPPPCYKPEKQPAPTCCVPCLEGRPGGPCFEVYVGPLPCYKPEKPPAPTCCVPCSEGRPGGPCFEVYGGPAPCYHGNYYWRPVYDSYGGRRPCYVSCCDQYLNEDNATGCTIM